MCRYNEVSRAEHNKYDQVIPIYHGQQCKINDVAKALDVYPLKFYKTEVYINELDYMLANDLLYQAGIDINKPFGFTQTHCGLDKRDFPDNYGRNYLNSIGLDQVFEVGVGYNQSEIPITAEFAVMEHAVARVLPNSCFYHAACAMELKIDLAYFADGEQGFNKIQHLHPVNQKAVFKLWK